MHVYTLKIGNACWQKLTGTTKLMHKHVDCDQFDDVHQFLLFIDSAKSTPIQIGLRAALKYRSSLIDAYQQS